SEQFLLDQGREPKVEVIFPEAARAGGTRGLRRVSDVHDDAKGGMVAGRTWRFLRRTTGAFGPRALPCALPEQQREGDDRSHPPMQSHQTYPNPLAARPPLIGLWQAQNLLCNEIEDHMWRNWRNPRDQDLPQIAFNMEFLGITHAAVGHDGGLAGVE